MPALVNWFALLVILAAAPLASAQAPAATAAAPPATNAPAAVDPAAEVKQRLAGYVEAFNKHDSPALAEFWAEDATWTNRDTGETASGRVMGFNSHEAAAKSMGVPQLRDADLELLLSKKGALDQVTFRRARHVVTEDARSIAFKKALAETDRDGIFALMKGSHDSLKDDYEVSCTELDAMAQR